MKHKAFLFFAAFLCASSFAASVDTVVIFSSSMRKPVKCAVVKPDCYDNNQRHFPVVYLLHGFSDRYDTWLKKVPEIKRYADEMQMMIVCPDGGYSSWYFDSPVDSSFRYETLIGTEVVQYIDNHYRTLADRGHRAITGHSMGGHGALYLVLRHPEIFGAVGSMSGGVDMRPFPGEWDIAKRIGDIKTHPGNWQNMSVTGMINKPFSTPLSIMIDCGTDDFFYQVNHQLHAKMIQLKIPHDYVERPGRHTWAYWANAIEYQLLFFRKYFSQIFAN
ncbi:MAG: alpha/beta hydrolase family protein [bacterium]